MYFFKIILAIFLTTVLFLLAQVVFELILFLFYFADYEIGLRWLAEKENFGMFLFSHFVISAFLIIPGILLPLFFYKTSK